MKTISMLYRACFYNLYIIGRPHVGKTYLANIIKNRNVMVNPYDGYQEKRIRGGLGGYICLYIKDISTADNMMGMILCIIR